MYYHFRFEVLYLVVAVQLPQSMSAIVAVLEYHRLFSFRMGFLAYYCPLLIYQVRNKWSIPIWTTPSCIYHIVTALWRGPSENPVAAARPVTRTRLRESLPKLK